MSTSSGKTILAATGVAGSAAVSSMDNQSKSKAHSASYILGYITTLIALFLAFKCKTAYGGIDFVQVIVAFICSPCYILYRLAQPCR
jgi:hypothetical protein